MIRSSLNTAGPKDVTSTKELERALDKLEQLESLGKKSKSEKEKQIDRLMSKSNKQEISDVDELIEGQALDDELYRLQQGYRRMIQCNQQVSKVYNAKQKRRIAALEQLEKEEVNLNIQSVLIQNKDNTNHQSGLSNKIMNLYDIIRELVTSILWEREKIDEMDYEYQVLEKSIQNRRKTGFGNSSRFDIEQMQKLELEAKTLKDRLHSIQVRFNKTLTRNREYREAIDNLQKKRKNYETIYTKLFNELEDCRSKMIEDMEESKIAFEQRDEYRVKIAALKERFEKDRYNHETELKDLQRIILHDEKMKNFMLTKNNDRESLKSIEEAKRKIQTAESEPMKNERELIQSYEDAFEQIRAVTNEDEIEVVIENYRGYEEKNFALFKLVEELHSEIEMLRQQATKYKLRKGLLNNEDTIVNFERKSNFEDLKKELSEINEEAEEVKRKFFSINTQFNDLKRHIENLLHVSECDRSILHEMLDSDDLKPSNVMIFLGILEQRVNEIISMAYYYEQKDLLHNPSKQSQFVVPIIARTVGKKQSAVIVPSISYTDLDKNLEFISSDEEVLAKSYDTKHNDIKMPISVENMRQKIASLTQKKTQLNKKSSQSPTRFRKKRKADKQSY
ncbi:DgyrCDS7660 [Dimorphilus gyrociliatus]|uniref:DgyrCDS7660 n=1 Tax=Dimorphilus gyrociliatus TaxID=2664684 RepID=A0A7I8VTY7_9ANNE|nr:DgyrCDS7660 [Dimorphilus gyrociliatus]